MTLEQMANDTTPSRQSAEIGELDELLAADRFRQTVLYRADHRSQAGPMWFGWVIVEAFLAGVKWSKENRSK